MSKTAFQEWQYVLGQNGVSISALETGMKTFQGTMDGTSKNGVAAMEKLGISFQNMNQEEAFNAAIAGLQGVDDETQRATLAADLFGAKAAQEMIPLLNQTAKSTDELKNRAHDLGIVMGDDAVNAGVVFGDTLSDVQQSLGAVQTKIGNAVIPILTSLLTKFLEYMPVINRLIDTAITPLVTAFASVAAVVVEVLVKALEYLMPVIENIVNAFSELMNFINNVFAGNWSAAWQNIVNAFGNIFQGLKNLLKEPINWIIGKLNTFLGSLNNIKIPDWVPGVGGKGFNIPSIPLLASGGNVVDSGAAVVGEAGAELIELPKGARVTPLDNKHSTSGNITQNNYFTQRELSPYETQLQVKRLSRSLAGAF